MKARSLGGHFSHSTSLAFAETLGYRQEMSVTLRLTEEEQLALQKRADAEGISIPEAARRAVREYLARGERQDRLEAATNRVITAHGEALQRLGE